MCLIANEPLHACFLIPLNRQALAEADIMIVLRRVWSARGGASAGLQGAVLAVLRNLLPDCQLACSVFAGSGALQGTS